MVLAVVASIDLALLSAAMLTILGAVALRFLHMPFSGLLIASGFGLAGAALIGLLLFSAIPEHCMKKRSQ